MIEIGYQAQITAHVEAPRASGSPVTSGAFLQVMGMMQTRVQQTVSGAQSAGAVTGTSSAQALSLEDMLRQVHPQLAYHVLDATTENWKRNDYPHYLLYQNNLDPSLIENWKPSGPEPDQIRSLATQALCSVPSGSTAVVIHPDVQAKMDADPSYAKVIFDRIEAWFTFDELRNAAVMPVMGGGRTDCRSIAIGPDGEIANVQAFTGPDRSAGSKAGSEENKDTGKSWWDARMERFDMYMERWTERQREHAQFMSLQLTEMSMQASAKEKLRALLRSGTLEDTLGSTIAGTPVTEVIKATCQTVFGSLSF